jgi:SLT domain-containing protein
MTVFDVGVVRGELHMDTAPLAAAQANALADLKEFTAKAGAETTAAGEKMGTGLAEGLTPFQSGLAQATARVNAFATSSVEAGAKAGQGIRTGLTEGITGATGAITGAVTQVERLGAAATIAGSQAAAAMERYTAAAEAAAGGNAAAIASLDRFAAEATVAAAKAEDALKMYAAQATVSGHEAGQGLARGVEEGTAEANASMERSTELMRGLAGGLLAGFAIGGAIEGMKEAAKAASDDAIGIRLVKLQFGEASEEVLHFGDNAANSFGLSAGAANAATAKFGEFLGSFKIGGAQAAEMSIQLVKLSADIGRFANADPLTVEAAIQTALKGRATALKQFGVNVSQATVQQYAYTHSIAAQGAALNDQQKALATYGAIMEQTKDKQGAFVASQGTLQTSELQLKANMENMAAAVGRAVIPTLSALGDILVNIVVPGIQGLFGLIQPLLDGFAAMPKPVQDIVAGLGILLMLRGPLIGMFTGIGGAITGFTEKVALAKVAALEFGEEMSTTAAVVRVAGAEIGAGITSAMGIAGIALLGITAAFGLFGESADHAKIDIENQKTAVEALSDTLDHLSGKLTVASAVKIEDDWIKDGTSKKFEDLGLSVGKAAASIVAGGKATEDFRGQILNTSQAIAATVSVGIGPLGQAMNNFGRNSQEAAANAKLFENAALSGNDAIQAAATAYEKQGGSAADATKAMQAYRDGVYDQVPALKAFNQENDVAITATQEFKDIQEANGETTASLTKKQKDSTAANLANWASERSGLNQASQAYGGYANAAMIASVRVSAAVAAHQQAHWALPVTAIDSFTGLAGAYSRVYSSMVEVKTASDGTMTAVTGMSNAFVNYTKETSGASAETDLFRFAMLKLSNGSLTAQQTIDAHAASVRAIGQAYRDQRANADAVTQATIDLKNATEKKIDKDYSSQQKSLDVAAAQRHLADATDTAAASTANITNKEADLQGSTATLLQSVVTAADKQGGYNAAIKAGEKAMNDSRAAFILQASTQGGTQKATEKSTADAEKLATKLGLIPGNVKTIIDADPHLAEEGIAAVQAKLNSVHDKTVKLVIDATGGTMKVNSDGSFTTSAGGHGMADGGWVRGAGTETSDSIDKRLSLNEFVVKASAAKKNAAALEYANEGGVIPGFAQGGHVGALHIVSSSTGSIQPALNFEASFMANAAASAKASNAAAAARAAAIPKANGGGTEQWRAMAEHVAQVKGEPTASVQVLLNQMSRESGGNPRAINLTDINAQQGHPSVGLLQFIPSTFFANADPGFNTNVWDPESQMHAWYNYINADYGGFAQFAGRGYGPYAAGGLVGGDILGRVSNNEFIANTGAVEKNLAALQYINSGGTIPGFAAGGLVSAYTLAGNTAPTYSGRQGNVLDAFTQVSDSIHTTAQAVNDLRVNSNSLHHDLVAAMNERAHLSRNASAADRAAAANAVATAQKNYQAAQIQTNRAQNELNGILRNQAQLTRMRGAENALAAAYDRTEASIVAVTDKENALKDARASLAGSISSTVSGFDSGILGHLDSRTNADMANQGLQYDAAKAQQFTANLKRDIANGLSSQLVSQIAQAGVEGGGQVAAEYANASRSQIATANAAQAALNAAGVAAGNLAANDVYNKSIASLDKTRLALTSLAAQQNAVINHMAAVITNELKGWSVNLSPAGLARLVRQGDALVARRA